jgi:hypothetical protein
MMTLHRMVFSSAVVGVLLLSSIHAQKSTKSPGANTLFPVTADFRCPLSIECVSDDQIEGDALGPYRGATPEGSATTPEAHSTTMGSYLTEGNLFFFTLKSDRGRTISFDFGRPLGAAPCAAAATCRKTFSAVVTDRTPHGSRTYPVDAMGTDLPNGFESIPVGQSARARLFLNFEDPAGRELLWTVRFDPRLYPGTTHLTVTRPAVNQWIIEAGDSHIAQLVSEPTTTKGKSTKTNEGYYTMPFKITVTK